MRSRIVIFLIAISMIVSACGVAGESAATSTPFPTDTPIVPPTLTATPTIPLAVLVVPADLDPDTSNLYQKTVYDLAQTSGLRFQVRNTLTPADIEPGLKVVIVLPPDPGIASLAATEPNVQFLAINLPDVTPGGNVSVLGNNSQSDISAFLAGYTAALITNDYRIGMMIPKDNADAIRALNAFANGMKFYCGSCRPLYYFQWAFPQYIEIGADENPSNYYAYADILIFQYNFSWIYFYHDISK